LVAALENAAARGTGTLTFHLPTGPAVLNTGALLERAIRAAGQLDRHGIAPGDTVALLGRNRPEWVVAAFAVWLCGGTLVPLQLPLRVNDRPAFQARTMDLLRDGRCKLVISQRDFTWAAGPVPVITWETLESKNVAFQPLASTADSPVVIQYTSGSTSSPKGVVLDNRAVMAQMSMLMSLYDESDVVASWVPFFHDLGLFHTVCFPITALSHADLVPTELFARQPSLWLETASRGRASLMLAPLAGWMTSLRDVQRRSLSLDLSTVRTALSGAEMVDPAGLITLQHEGAAHGLRPLALGTTYGLAEATLVVATSRPGTGSRFALRPQEGHARPPAVLASAGPPLPDVGIRIINGGNIECGEGEPGEIHVSSPSNMRGYLNLELPDPTWIATGDEGFLKDGELFVSGRLKDMVTAMGQNVYPEDIEWAAQRVVGVRPGRVVAFSDADRRGVVVAVEVDDEAPEALSEEIRGRVADVTGVTPSDVVILARGTILKTSSGKLRRAALAELLAPK
jgi:fatty-acyl-CoA synthase